MLVFLSVRHSWRHSAFVANFWTYLAIFEEISALPTEIMPHLREPFGTAAKSPSLKNKKAPWLFFFKILISSLLRNCFNSITMRIEFRIPSSPVIYDGSDFIILRSETARPSVCRFREGGRHRKRLYSPHCGLRPSLWWRIPGSIIHAAPRLTLVAWISSWMGKVVSIADMK